MDRLKRSHFLEELTGKVHLTHFDAVSSINPDLARRTQEMPEPTLNEAPVLSSCRFLTNEEVRKGEPWTAAERPSSPSSQ